MRVEFRAACDTNTEFAGRSTVYIYKGGLALKHRELGLILGFLMCLRDSQTVRLQPSRWKRSLLLFSSGVCLEIAVLPFISGWLGYGTSWQLWLLTCPFGPLGLLGLYASKYGTDRLVERLLVIPKLDLGI